ncbi:MAG: MBL fold metallo-hydrolase [Terracidiphilus sp.]|jgi:hydroxyacylglutathione hydrolase
MHSNLQIVTLEMHSASMTNFSYLVSDGGHAVLIDPAWEMDKIRQALSATAVRLSAVLLTHSHSDHVNLARSVEEKYDCPIWMSHHEITASGFYARNLIGIDESPRTIGSMLIEPILTPGHTPGSLCFRIGNNLFTGDVLFAEGCGYCENLEAAYAMYASLEKLKGGILPQTRIYPGHSFGKPPGQSISQVREDNMYLHFSSPESFAAFRLRAGQKKVSMRGFSMDAGVNVK